MGGGSGPGAPSADNDDDDGDGMLAINTYIQLSLFDVVVIVTPRLKQIPYNV